MKPAGRECAFWMAGLAVGAQFLFGSSAVRAQQPPAPLPTLQANARAVLIDVVVTDAHGHAIHGLTRQDFQVIEDGAEQRVSSLEETHPPAAPNALVPVKPLPVNTFTNARKSLATAASTVILLDALDTPLSAQSYSRDQLLKFVNTMQPSGPVAIFQLDTQLHMIQGFTSDPEELRRAVKERAKILETVIPRTPGYVSTQFRYDDLTRAFSNLGTYLAQFPGRKNLIWFTGSVPVYAYDDGAGLGGALRDPESFSFDYTQSTALLTLGRVSIYPIDAEGLRTDPSFSAERGGRAPSIGELSNFSLNEGIKHQDLMDVAAATGGRAFVNTNGIRQAIGEVIEIGANYYTLSYTPTNTAWNGEYRRVKVSLDRPDLRLEYREGYYARRETGLANAKASRRQITNHATVAARRAAFPQALQLGAVDPGGVVFEARITAPQSTLDGSTVPVGQQELEAKFQHKPVREFTVAYTLDGTQLRLTAAPDGRHTGAVEFAVLVLDDQGRMVNSALATVQMNVPAATYQRMLETGVQMPIQVAVPAKGNYFLRAGVHDLTSDLSGVVEVPIGEVKLGPVP